MILYVAVDIGCIECGEDSAVLGVFEDADVALDVCNESCAYQKAHWNGQHEFMVYEVPGLGVRVPVYPREVSSEPGKPRQIGAG